MKRATYQVNHRPCQVYGCEALYLIMCFDTVFTFGSGTENTHAEALRYFLLAICCILTTLKTVSIRSYKS